MPGAKKWSSKGRTAEKPKEDPNETVVSLPLAPSPAAPAAVEWSAQQKAIFKECKNPTSPTLVVEALAGTGKTTTIVKATHKLQKGRTLVCAFNTRIAQELQSRNLAWNAEAKTLHALGLAYLKSAMPAVRVDDHRSIRLIEQAEEHAQKRLLKSTRWELKALLSYVKETEPSVFSASRPVDETLYDVAIANEFLTSMPAYERANAIDVGTVALNLMQKLDGTADFSDMLWLPLVHEMVKPRYETVVIDEAQDMNPAQLLLAKGATANRLIAVGDSHQAIYGFRGASSEFLRELARLEYVKSLKLDTTYRCPKAVVRIAQQWVPQYKAADSAPEGLAIETKPDYHFDKAKPGDFILSRLNAPLVGTALHFIRNGVKARVEGKEIGKGLVDLLYKSKTFDLRELDDNLSGYIAQRMQKLDPDKDAAKIELLHDQASALLALAEDARDVDEVKSRIASLFEDTGGRADVITLSTIHKAKGLEADRVFVLRDTFFAPRDGESMSEEEGNLRYVAVTRAKKELYLVGEEQCRGSQRSFDEGE